MADGNQHSMARRLLRPANYAPDLPGWGVYEGRKNDVPYAVINLQGRVFMAANDDPFRVADKLLKEIKAKVVFVDVHAEATSEKLSLAWYLDGRVTAVVGTHTHIPTADERVLPGGTAYITDVGMTGPYDSVIGVQKELIIARFLNNMPARFEAATGDVRLCAVVVDCDEATGHAEKNRKIDVDLNYPCHPERSCSSHSEVQAQSKDPYNLLKPRVRTKRDRSNTARREGRLLPYEQFLQLLPVAPPANTATQPAPTPGTLLPLPGIFLQLFQMSSHHLAHRRVRSGR